MAIMKSKSERRQRRAARKMRKFEDKYGQYKPDPVPELDTSKLGQQQAAQALDVARDVKYRGPETTKASMDQIRGLYSALGIQEPEDIRQQERDVAYSEIERAKYDAALAAEEGAQRSGMRGTGTQLALAQQRASAAGQARSQAALGIDRAHQDRMAGYQRALLGDIYGQMGRSRQDAAQRYAADVQGAQMQMGALGNVGAKQTGATMAGYQYNQMQPWEQDAMWKQVAMNDAAQRKAGLATFGGMAAGHGLYGLGIYGSSQMGGGGMFGKLGG